jgi:hypothetical protein
MSERKPPKGPSPKMKAVPPDGGNDGAQAVETVSEEFPGQKRIMKIVRSMRTQTTRDVLKRWRNNV